MTGIVFREADGREAFVEARDGETVMRAARSAGVEGILGECGGSMSCLTCHCYVASGDVARIPPPTDDEAELLACLMERRETSRLSCQIVVAPGMAGTVFTLPGWQG